MSGVRLLPVLVFGLVSLLSIKLLSMAFNAPPHRAPEPGASPFARSITLAREGTTEADLITGAIGKKDNKEKSGAAMPADGKPGPVDPAVEAAELEKAKANLKAKAEPEGIHVALPNGNSAGKPAASSAERALLEKLKDRRGEIEAQGRDLELRDNLLRLGERKLDDRIGELRSLESQLGQSGAKNDTKTRYRPLVVMYESMKPKDAARVFDRLDVRILIDLVGHMNPRKVSEILAAMEPTAAEKLTVALARQAQGDAQLADNAPGQADIELPRLPVQGAPRR